MNALRILTVDDETLALRRLKLLLETLPDADHVGEARGFAEAIEKVGELRPDVVLLDIRMRDGSGFDVVDTLSERKNPPAIVFVSAFDQFAIRAFEASVVDYVLKPVERDRLASALTRARRHREAADSALRIAELREIVRNLRTVTSHAEQSRYETEFWLKNASGFVRVAVDAIDWVSSEDEYVRFHTPGGSYLMRGSIRSLERRLDPALFIRAHRRTLIRKHAIAELRTPRFGNPEVVLRNGAKLKTGRVYAKNVRAACVTR
jgi:two-component system LytT family response regulator